LLAELQSRDANRSQLHLTTALLRRYQNRLPESRVELERAIELDANNSVAYGQLGLTLIYLGDPAAAIPLEEKRIRLNPNEPNNAIAYWALGLAHLLLGQLDTATDWLTKACAANPRVYYFRLDLAAVLALQGDIEQAKAALAESIRLKPEINSMARVQARWAYTNNRRCRPAPRRHAREVSAPATNIKSATPVKPDVKVYFAWIRPAHQFDHTGEGRCPW
jgi:tetratricopeptide (TPR) repeat protein